MVNRGIRASQPDTEIYILLNTDVILRPSWLDTILNKFDEDPNIGIVGYQDNTPEDKEDEEVLYPEYITGHCLGIRREVR